MASPSASTWHTINPQTRPLTLSILELTPLALTLSLTLAPLPFPPQSHHHSPAQHVAHTHNHAHGPKNRKKARHGNRRPESEDEADPDEDTTHLASSGTGHITGGIVDLSTNFKDLLSHGVVVSVNGQPWNRIVAHVSDPEEDHEVVVDGDDQEEGDWEDDAETAVAGEGAETELGSEGVTRRRPRKARFGSSAGTAVKTEEDKGVIKQKPRDSKERPKIDRDRAVVVVYGLSPGKEYEIELQVVGLTTPEGLDPLVSNSILIPPSPSPLSGGLSRSRANSLRSRSRPRSRSNSLSTPHPAHSSNSTAHSSESSMAASPGRITPPTSGSGDLHPAPIPTNILNPVDTQAAQIRHMIAAAHAEKEHVQTQIKEARRASQRAEAALRSEIETVKKATEKAGTLDLRAKQKTLALQEQVKQGWAAAESAEEEADGVEHGMDDLEDRLRSTTINVESVKNEFRFAKEHEDDVREKDKKTRVDIEKRMVDIHGKIEKLRAKKDKKEIERAELERRLDELEKQREEAEKKNEDDTKKRRSSAYWWDPYSHGQHTTQNQHGPHVQAHSHGPIHGHGPNDHARTLTNHPSLNNLSSHGGFQGFRGRGGYTGRYPSAGSAVRPSPSQPSPTQASSFYPLQHPIPTANTSPAFRPPKLNSPSPAISNRTPSSSGVNVAALPFHPANVGHENASQHTTLMPPQLQHRIYLPNVRPRPSPNFNPPPSVLAEQAQRHSPTTLSAPSFPPLPGQNLPSPGGTGKALGASGPSLASIVTRAVLSPTSALAAQGLTSGTKPSPPPGSGTGVGPLRSPPFPRAQSPITPSTSASTPPIMSMGTNSASSRQVTFGPSPSASERSDFPPLSPTGPWAGFGGGALSANLVRTQTPSVMGKGQDRDSPASLGSGGQSRKGTGDS